MKSLYFAAVAALILALASCKEKSLEEAALPELLQADAIMETDPAGAYKKLCEIDPAKVKKGVNRALYSLLITQAEDKNFIDSTSDNVIAIASDFFDSNPGLSPEHRMRAHFYHARILYNARHYASASEHLMVALDIAGQLKSHYWLGRINYQLSDICTETFNYPEAIDYLKTTCTEFKLDSNEGFLVDATADLARAYNNICNYQLALKTINSMQHMNLDDSVFKQTTRSKAIAHFYLGNDSQAKEEFSRLALLDNGNGMKSMDYSNLSYIYASEHKYDSALFCLKKAQLLLKDISDSAHMHHRYLNYYLMVGNTAKAQEASNNMMLIIGKAWENATSNHVAIGKSKHLSSKAENEHRQKMLYRKLLIAITISVSAIILALLFSIAQYKKRKESESVAILTKYDALLNSLKNNTEKQIDEPDQVDNSDNSSILSLIETQFKFINSISKRLYAIDYQPSEHKKDNKPEEENNNNKEHKEKREKNRKKKDPIIEGFKPLLKKLGSKESIKLISSALNHLHGNIIQKLDDVCPSLDNEDRTIMILIIAGMSSHTICIILDKSIGAFRIKKFRLKDDIAKSKSQWKNEILNKL